MSDVDLIFLSRCIVCGKPYKPGRQYTCNEACHQRFMGKKLRIPAGVV